MANKFSQDYYSPKNASKYVGTKKPRYRSSWELKTMQFLDTNQHIVKWASEAIQIPYFDPINQRQTYYVPDFFVQYINNKNIIVNEVWEIKPAKHQLLEHVGKNQYDQAQFIKNQAKWKAAYAYCAQNSLTFRILNEFDLFHNGAPQSKKLKKR
jgi:hypothetical protein